MQKFVISTLILSFVLALGVEAGISFGSLFGDEKPADRALKALAKEASKGSSSNRCTPEYASRIGEVYYRNNGLNIHKVTELYIEIRRKVMKDCSKKFSSKAKTMHEVLQSVEYLRIATQGYKVGSEWTEGEAGTVRKIVDVMYAMPLDPINDIDEFVRVWNQDGPCAKLYEQLSKSGLDDYVEFLRLAALEDYYPNVSSVHKENVDALGACDHIKNTGGLYEAAFEAYRMHA